MQTYFVIAVQLLGHVWLFVTPWTAVHQASLSVTKSQSLLKLMSIELVMPSNHLILCHPVLLSPSIFPSIMVFSNESALHNRWAKYWNFIFSISPSNDSGWISFRIDWSSCCPRNSQESLCYSAVKKKKFPKSIGLQQYEFIFALKSVGHLLIHTRFGWPKKTLVMHSWTAGVLSGNWQVKDSLMHRSGIAHWDLSDDGTLCLSLCSSLIQTYWYGCSRIPRESKTSKTTEV